MLLIVIENIVCISYNKCILEKLELKKREIQINKRNDEIATISALTGNVIIAFIMKGVNNGIGFIIPY